MLLLIFDNKEIIIPYISACTHDDINRIMNNEKKQHQFTTYMDIINNSNRICDELTDVLKNNREKKDFEIKIREQMKNDFFANNSNCRLVLHLLSEEIQKLKKKIEEKNDIRKSLNSRLTHTKHTSYPNELLETHTKEELKEIKYNEEKKLIRNFIYYLDDNYRRFQFLFYNDKSGFKEALGEQNIERFYYDFILPQGNRILVFKELGKYVTYHSYASELFKKTQKVDAMFEYILNHEITKMGKEINLDLYKIENIQELLDTLLGEIYDYEGLLKIKKCKNCKKTFISEGKQVYCNFSSPQNPQKTCRELSDDTRNSNEYYRIYRKYYKKEFARVNRSREFQEESLNLYEEAKKNNMNLVEYEAAMKQLYARLVNGKE